MLQNNRSAILLVAFGTTVLHASEAYTRFERCVRNYYPGLEIRWAFNSGMVRKKLALQGIIRYSVLECISQLVEDGYRVITVLPLYIIPGHEYHLMQKSIAGARNSIGMEGVKISVGKVLLADYDDALRVAKAMVAFAPEKRISNDAIVFMGHGSAKHGADLYYTAMKQILSELDEKVYIGTVEGHPTVEDVLKQCHKNKTGRVLLIPFMAVAGDHAINDMAGDEPDSWKSKFKANGMDVETVLNGILDNPLVADVWLEHLDEALRLNIG